MPTYLITGANRGLGLEFVRQLSASSSNTILATMRDPSGPDARDVKALADKASGKVHLIQMDVSKESSISTLKDSVSSAIGSDAQIDYLLNNAGINATPQETSLSMTRDSLHNHMDINVLGPAKVVETLLSHLKKGSVVLNMTSGLGSNGLTLDTIKESKCATYAISKAATNMLTTHQSFALKDRGVRVICMDPGWVKTRMGGEGAVLEPEDSIGGMLKTIHGLGENETGKFFTYTGKEVAW